MLFQCLSKAIKTKLPDIPFYVQNEMVDHCTIAIIAKRASGKSFLTREIMYKKRHVSCAVAISRTEKLNSFWERRNLNIFKYLKNYLHKGLSKLVIVKFKKN